MPGVSKSIVLVAAHLAVCLLSRSAAAQPLELPRAMHPAVVEPELVQPGMIVGEPTIISDEPVLVEPIYLDESGESGPMRIIAGPPPADAWTWQVVPDGLMYRSYLAGVHEPRLSTVVFHEEEEGALWDMTVGARVGLFRYGTTNAFDPQGYQLDVEGAALPRLNPEDDADLVSTDYRAGVPMTYSNGRYRAKFGYYHISSHVGDEFLLDDPGFDRINYSRDAIVLGQAFYPTPDVRIYGEAAWAFRTSGGSEPWDFQFGFEYSPARASDFNGDPFLAVNGHLREEVDFGGNVVFQTGWQWRGRDSGHLLRIAFQYYNGKSPQFSFFDEHEEHLGVGVFYDF